MVTKKKTKKDPVKEPEKKEEQHLCAVSGCGKPAAIREDYCRGKDVMYFCYEHHMDNLTCLTLEDMVAGVKRPGMF